MAFNLGSARGDITITYDSRGVAHARDSLGRFVAMSEVAGRAMDDNDKKSKKSALSFARFGKAVLFMTKWITIGSSAIQSLAFSANLLIGIVAALGPALVVPFSLLPALIFSAIGALAVFKLAMVGVGDAMKAAASGDAAKLAEATKNLAPSAKAFVVQIAGAVKALKPLQQAVQQAFFAGFADKVPGAVANLKSMQSASTGLAGSFSKVGNAFGTFLAAPAFTQALAGGMGAVSKILDAIAPGITPLLIGFSDMAAHGAALVKNISPLTGILANVGAWLSNFDIAAAFKGAAVALAPLIQLLRDLGTIVMAVFTALGGGKDALGMLTEIVHKIAEFTKSDAGIAALGALGQAIGAIAGTAGQVLLQLLNALAPAVVMLAPLFTQLATTLGALLGPIIAALSPILAQLVGILSGTLAPLLPTIADAIGTVASALLPFIQMLVSGLGPIIQQLGPVIGALATALGIMLAAAIRALMPIVAALMPVFQQIATELFPQLIPLILQLAQGFAAASPVMLLMANLLTGVLVVGLKLLIPVLSFLIQGLTGVIMILTAIIGPIAAFIGKWTEATKIVEIVRTVFQVVMDTIISRVAVIQSIVSSGIRALISAFQWLASLPGMVSGWFASIVTAVSGKVSAVLGVVRSIPGQISSALGNLGSMLFGAGQDIINGLVNGIRSLAGRAVQAAKDAVSGIPGAIKGLLGIGSPSKVTMALGEDTTEGFAVGLLNGIKRVISAAQRAAGAVSLGLPTDIGASVSSAVSASVVATSGAPSVARTAPAPAVAGNVYNTTVNAPQNMSPAEVGRAVASRLAFSVSTGATAPAAA